VLLCPVIVLNVAIIWCDYKKSAVVIALQALKAKKHQVFAFVLPVFVLVGCVGIDAIIMVSAYRKFVQKHAMRIKGK
ncbi:hypothetical protein, partial [Escherichia coli]